MSKVTKTRIVELQQRLKIANDALAKIQAGCRDPEGVASSALYDMMTLEPKQPLQGLVGHGNSARGMDALRAAAKLVAGRRGYR
jgi:hypothetical protein